MMDVCCGLGTVSLAGQALTKAVTSIAPTDKRGIQVRHLVLAYSVCHQGHGKPRVFSEPCMLSELYAASSIAQNSS